jgi:hypothetical protein
VRPTESLSFTYPLSERKRQPVVDAATVATEIGVTPQNAQRTIAPLVEAGILTEFTGFKRNRMWQCREVLSALDDFAARAGRRR